MRHGRWVRVGLRVVGLMVVVAGLQASPSWAAGEVRTAGVTQVGEGTRAVPGQAWALDLGEGVKLEFVWIEALKGWVGKYEVTNAEYRRFNPDHRSRSYHGKSIDGDRLPVAYVSFDNAAAFCAWVNAAHAAVLPAGFAVRLPDGDEWTIFAQCGDGRKFPWGDEWPPKYGNYRDETGAKAFAHWQGVRIEGYDDGFDVACPVEQSCTNDWGLYGVGGNVWELTSQSQGEHRTMRGGSWHRHDPGNVSCDIRRSYPRSSRDSGVGFRVVALPTGAPSGSPNPGDAEAPAAPSVVRPPTLKRLVTKAAPLGEKWAGIPGIEITKKGRIYVTFFSGGEKEPSPENVIYLTTSDDGGTTFTKPAKIVDVRNAARAYDPMLWLAPNGVLWLVFNRSNPDAGLQGIFARTCSDPDATQPQWGDEFRVGYEGMHSARLNKAIALSSGEWVMPAMHLPKSEQWPGTVRFHGVGISGDEGRTWTLHGDVVAPGHSLESMVVERQDASLVMYVRCSAGVIWQSESRDRGRTWSKGRATTIPNPGARFHVRRLPDGDWLLINSPDPRRRTGMVACLSRDEGTTWTQPLTLDERNNVSYPDAALAPDGTLYAVYDRERTLYGEILMAVFREADMPARLAAGDGSPPAPTDVAEPGEGGRRVSVPALSFELGDGVKMELVWIPPGEFLMGSPADEQGRNSDEDQRRVTISRGFWMGKYEVTQAQWRQIMGDNRSQFTGAKHPVEMVSWKEVQEFVKKLNDAIGRAPLEGQDDSPDRFRLPTEAEWEYACRAGTTTAFHTGDALVPGQANFDANYPGGGRRTMPVGGFEPNAFGLHDMHGNVWEWCQDWYSHKQAAQGAATDPSGPTAGITRVLRGGCWIVGGTTCRSAARAASPASRQDVLTGFRVVGFSTEPAGRE